MVSFLKLNYPLLSWSLILFNEKFRIKTREIRRLPYALTIRSRHKISKPSNRKYISKGGQTTQRSVELSARLDSNAILLSRNADDLLPANDRRVSFWSVWAATKGGRRRRGIGKGESTRRKESELPLSGTVYDRRDRSNDRSNANRSSEDRCGGPVGPRGPGYYRRRAAPYRRSLLPGNEFIV